MSQTPKPTAEFEEDLFRFDEVTAEAVRLPPVLSTEPAAAHAVAAAPVPAAGSKTASMPAHALIDGHTQAAPTLVPAAAQAQPAQIRAAAPPTSSQASSGGAKALVPVSRGKVGLSPWTWVALGAAAVLNLALVGLCWKSLRAVQGAVVDIGHQVMSTAGEREQVVGSAVTSTRNWSAPTESTSVQSSLERVESELDSGQYGLARQRLYTLLAVCDRLGVDDREDFEVHARFLLAESWRRQAAAEELGPNREEGRYQP